MGDDALEKKNKVIDSAKKILGNNVPYMIIQHGNDLPDSLLDGPVLCLQVQLWVVRLFVGLVNTSESCSKEMF